jgi:hypothetical protein
MLKCTGCIDITNLEKVSAASEETFPQEQHTCPTLGHQVSCPVPKLATVILHPTNSNLHHQDECKLLRCMSFKTMTILTIFIINSLSIKYSGLTKDTSGTTFWCWE